MIDDLRTRIAAAIYSVQKPWDGFSFAELSEYTQSLYREQADAVIRELGLETQCHYDPDCDYYRYVTDWMSPTDDTADDTAGNVNDG